jgi:hypothetical protein
MKFEVRFLDNGIMFELLSFILDILVYFACFILDNQWVVFAQYGLLVL